uniref:Uncharacterized protein n=1 Tax=Oryza brachyantha TaxID=4533 RepID=J3MSI3_ORYBR
MAPPEDEQPENQENDMEQQEEHDESEGEDLVEIDPADVYTFDDFLAEDQVLDSFRRKIGDKLKAKLERACWAGMFTRGDKKVPTMILEAVSSRDLRIWHAFFGTAGAYNDINVLNKSPLFINAIKGEAPRVQFVVNGNQYDMAYYLADRIYPEWAAFGKTISKP